jgi:hypothetical protein
MFANLAKFRAFGPWRFDRAPAKLMERSAIALLLGFKRPHHSENPTRSGGDDDVR